MLMGRCIVVWILAVLASGSSLAQAMGVNLSGTWRDLNGGVIEITHQGNAVTCRGTNPPVTKWWTDGKGTIEGNHLVMVHSKHGRNTDTQSGTWNADGTRINWSNGTNWKREQPAQRERNRRPRYDSPTRIEQASAQQHGWQMLQSEDTRTPSGSTASKRPNLIFAEFDASGADVSNQQIQAALRRVTRQSSNFNVLPTIDTFTSVQQVGDLSTIDWGDAEPEYMILQPVIIKEGDRLTALGTLASMEQASLAEIEASADTLLELMAAFWTEIDKPIDSQGSASISGAWENINTKSVLLVTQSGPSIEARLVHSRLRPADDAWVVAQGQTVRADGKWTTSLTGYRWDYASQRWVKSGELPPGEIDVLRGRITLAGETWHRLAESPNAAVTPDLPTLADRVETMIVDLNSGASGDPELSYRLGEIEEACIRSLAGIGNVPTSEARELNDSLWRLTRAAWVKQIHGAYLVAGMRIVGDWWGDDSVKTSHGQVMGLKARFQPRENPQAADQIAFTVIWHEDLRGGQMIRGARDEFSKDFNEHGRYRSVRIQMVKHDANGDGNIDRGEIQERQIGVHVSSTANGIEVSRSFIGDDGLKQYSSQLRPRY